ncbi:MAG TPA: metal ABC transporter permease [Beijerinckiaceae bacterium]|nr:metal ABC transporter permease [Beijerinckiaceae bacterium]
MSFLQLDFPPLAAASLAALACALVGNYLVLTRRAMFSDALSHVMLPGVLVAYLVTGTTASLPMLAGGLGAAFVAAGLVQVLIRYGRVEPGAALGVVFTSLFAGGIVLMEQSGAARTTFDVHHILYGSLEALVWPDARGIASLADPAALAALPQALPRMVLVLALVGAMVAALRKDLALVAFDADFARASGVPVRRAELALLAATASNAATVAMIVCPAATARLLTRRLPAQIGLSLALALGAVWLGYAIAVLGPPALGHDLALNAAGVIGTVAGLAFVAAAWRAGVRPRPA